MYKSMWRQHTRTDKWSVNMYFRHSTQFFASWFPTQNIVTFHKTITPTSVAYSTNRNRMHRAYSYTKHLVVKDRFPIQLTATWKINMAKRLRCDMHMNEAATEPNGWSDGWFKTVRMGTELSGSLRNGPSGARRRHDADIARWMQ